MNIDLRIERLILEGVTITPAERRALGAVVEGELARLLVSGGLGPELAQGVAWPAVRADSIHIDRPFSPVQAGTQIARAVYSSLGGIQSDPRTSKRMV